MNETSSAPTGSDPSASEPLGSDVLRGHTDAIVLTVLRQQDRYGYEIYKAIGDATGGEYEIKEATLYATFRRLVRDGLVDAYWGDETQGGRRKYYSITDAGRGYHARAVRDWRATQKILTILLDTKDAR